MNHHITHSLTILGILWGASVSVVGHSLVLVGPLLTSSANVLANSLVLVMTNIDDESDAAWESFPTCIS